MIPVRAAAVALAAALASGGLAAPVIAQVAAPKLSKPQRAAFEAILDAVERAAAGSADAPVEPATWITHVLRASDGSHYVALHADLTAGQAPTEPVPMYARFAARRVGADTELPPARSAVADWLKGLRGDPLPMRASRSTTVPQGEVPVGGAAILAGDAGVEASNVLRLQDLERDRARRRPRLARNSGAPNSNRVPRRRRHGCTRSRISTRATSSPPAARPRSSSAAPRWAPATTTSSSAGPRRPGAIVRRSCTWCGTASRCPAPPPSTSR
ncbi:MAG: hypothetical protein U0P30_12100 [Vicinamibacterales bacterium]